jgi:hypothetical protein
VIFEFQLVRYSKGEGGSAAIPNYNLLGAQKYWLSHLALRKPGGPSCPRVFKSQGHLITTNEITKVFARLMDTSTCLNNLTNAIYSSKQTDSIANRYDRKTWYDRLSMAWPDP